MLCLNAFMKYYAYAFSWIFLLMKAKRDIFGFKLIVKLLN